VLAIDHRVRGGALLGEVDHGLGLEGGQRLADEGVVGEIADVDVDGQAGDLLPAADPLLEPDDGDQALHAHLQVVAAAGEVVHDADPVTPSGQVEGRRPPQIAISSKYQDVHGGSPFRSSRTGPNHAAQKRVRADGAHCFSITHLGFT
jgi:hypothetical protein